MGPVNDSTPVVFPELTAKIHDIPLLETLHPRGFVDVVDHEDRHGAEYSRNLPADASALASASGALLESAPMPAHPAFAIHPYGCQMNVRDSDLLARRLRAAGFAEAAS